MFSIAWLVLVAALLAGCGSGGGESGTSANPGPGSQLDAGSGTATISVSVEGPTAATVVYAVEFTLHLPQGVTLSADSEGKVSAGVLQATDSTALTGAKYLPATATSGGSVRVNIADPGGFALGSLAYLNCIVSRGRQVSAAGFTLDGFSARDANSAAIPGVTAKFTLKTP